MIRVAIIGGGISGLTAAYELELARQRGAPIDWHLYEASDRLGGIVETTRIPTPHGDYILEGGPDAWVTEKPWARELAVELGLEPDLIHSDDATRKTYIVRSATAGEPAQLLPIPERMRLMVPEDLGALDASPLFTPEAKRAYAAELNRADELKATALDRPGNTDADESVATFVHRHFGQEVLDTLAAPLLAGVFGGNVGKLSVRSVMPQFVALERDHGSLIAGLQAKAKQRGNTPPQPIFTTLRRGMASLVEAMVATLPPARLHMGMKTWPANEQGWAVLAGSPTREYPGGPFGATNTPSEQDIAERFDEIVIATPLPATRSFEGPIAVPLTQLLPTEASSALLATFTWPAETARTFTIPPGFGFLVSPHALSSRPEPTEPQRPPLSSRPEPGGLERSALSSRPERSEVERPAAQDEVSVGTPLLAATFVDQKFPHRAPAGARVLRAFFGGASAARLASAPDTAVAAAALAQLRTTLGPVPAPEHTLVRRWPNSLPQYEVGHLDRIARLEALVAATPGLHLLGNSFRGVGLPDLIRAARETARRIAASA